MSPIDRSKQFDCFSQYAWSNKFEVGSNPLIDTKKNAKLKTLLRIDDLAYGRRPRRFVAALKSKSYAKYQSELIRAYLEEPEQHLRLDCDRLVLTIKCTDKDISRIKQNVLKPAFSALGELLHIKKVPVGKINRVASREYGNAKTSRTRPIYKYAYRITIAGDQRRFLKLYLTDDDTTPTTFNDKDGKEIQVERLYGLRIDFIPDRFNEFDLSALFGHLKSAMSVRRYDQLIKTARVTRVDVGFIMFGVLSTYAYSYPKDGRVEKSSCMPNHKKDIKETTYIGNRYKSSHTIIYEKLLKELKDDLAKGLTQKQIEERVKTLAVSTRVERRHYPYRSRNKGRDFNSLPELKLPLPELAFIDPLLFQYLDDDVLTKLLQDQTIEGVLNAKKAIGRALKGKNVKKRVFKLNKQWFEQASEAILSYYQSLIVSANKPKRADVETYLAKGLHLPKVVPEDRAVEGFNADDANKSQQLAIKSEEANIAVVAGAGSGKTKTISERVKYLVEEHGVPKSKIVVLAYTKDASREIRGRIGYGDALSVSTFHSWCFNLLKCYFPERFGNVAVFSKKGEAIDRKLPGKQKEMLVQAISKAAPSSALKAEELNDYISFKVNTLQSFRQFIEDPKLVSEVKASYRAYNNLKRANNVIDFNDMLFGVYRSLKKQPEFLEHVVDSTDYLILDEMQDSNTIQWRIVKLLIKSGCQLFCVGDPAQSIYGFRGGTHTNLVNFNKFSKGGKSYSLLHSFRLKAPILALSNWVRTQLPNELEPLLPIQMDGELPVLVEYYQLDEMMSWLANDLRAKLKDGYGIDSIKIFVRTNTVKDKIVKHLKLAFEKRKQVKDSDIEKLVMTIHGAKGLECEVGYVIDPRFWNSKPDTKDEHLRLMYVALTRASDELIICKSLSGKRIYSDDQSSDYLLDDLCDQDHLFNMVIDS